MKYLNTFSILILLLVLSAFFVSCEDDDDKPNSEQNLEITESNIIGCWKVDKMTLDGIIINDESGTEYVIFKEDNKSIYFGEEGTTGRHNWNFSEDKETFFEGGSIYKIEMPVDGRMTFLALINSEGIEKELLIQYSKSQSCPEEESNPNSLVADISGFEFDYINPAGVYYRSYYGDDWTIESEFSHNTYTYVLSLFFIMENGVQEKSIGIRRTGSKIIEGQNVDGYKQYLTVESDAAYTEENGIITGTFSFTAEDEETGNIVTCTNGQFTIDKSTAKNDGISRDKRKERYLQKQNPFMNFIK